MIVVIVDTRHALYLQLQQFFYPDISVPNRIPVILQPDETFRRYIHPIGIKLRELASGNHLFPLRRP